MKDLRMETVGELVRLVEECNRRKEDADLYFSVHVHYPARSMPRYAEEVAGLHIELAVTYGIGPVGSETHHYGMAYAQFVLTDDRITNIATRRDSTERRFPDKPLTERSVRSLLKSVRALCEARLREYPPLSVKAQHWFHR